MWHQECLETIWIEILQITADQSFLHLLHTTEIIESTFYHHRVLTRTEEVLYKDTGDNGLFFQLTGNVISNITHNLVFDSIYWISARGRLLNCLNVDICQTTVANRCNKQITVVRFERRYYNGWTSGGVFTFFHVVREGEAIRYLENKVSDSLVLLIDSFTGILECCWFRVLAKNLAIVINLPAHTLGVESKLLDRLVLWICCHPQIGFGV